MIVRQKDWHTISFRKLAMEYSNDLKWNLQSFWNGIGNWLIVYTFKIFVKFLHRCNPMKDFILTELSEITITKTNCERRFFAIKSYHKLHLLCITLLNKDKKSFRFHWRKKKVIISTNRRLRLSWLSICIEIADLRKSFMIQLSH